MQVFQITRKDGMHQIFLGYRAKNLEMNFLIFQKSYASNYSFLHRDAARIHGSF